MKYYCTAMSVQKCLCVTETQMKRWKRPSFKKLLFDRVVTSFSDNCCFDFYHLILILLYLEWSNINCTIFHSTLLDHLQLFSITDL